MDATQPCLQGTFALGFEHGVEAEEDSSTAEMGTRIIEYKLGYIVGRSFGETVRQANLRVGAGVAGELGAKYGVDRAELVAALRCSYDTLLSLDGY